MPLKTPCEPFEDSANLSDRLGRLGLATFDLGPSPVILLAMRATAAKNTHADTDLVWQPSSIFSFGYDAHQVNWLIITRGKTSRFSLEAAPVHSQIAMRRTPNSSSRLWIELQLLLLNHQR